jgi:flagella basal body P-ring formation protein FlgA
LRFGPTAAFIAGLALLVSTAASANPLPDDTSAQTQLADQARAALAARYPGAEIQLGSGLSYGNGSLPQRVSNVSIVSENERGDAELQVNGTNADGTSASIRGWVHFNAWVPAWIAKRRVLPGERLQGDSFVLQKVDVAVGLAHEYRGLILSSDSDLSSLQARQTVLEGQFVLSNGVERIPDVKRGQAVRIRLNSGAVTLMTNGTAEEPGYVNDELRVMTAKTKKVLVGKLAHDGVVEVKL